MVVNCNRVNRYFPDRDGVSLIDIIAGIIGLAAVPFIAFAVAVWFVRAVVAG